MQSQEHGLTEFDEWEQVSQAIHPEIHFRRERSSQGPDLLSQILPREESWLEASSIAI